MTATRLVDVTAFGCVVRLELGGGRVEELLKEVLRTWDWCHASEVTTADDHDGPRVTATLDDGQSLERVADRLTPAVTLAAIEARKGELMMLHAAAVAHPETGRTAVLVGPSGAGKSTASRVLGRHFGYVSDETVALSRDLAVLPYPKPVSLFADESRQGKAQHAPADLGLVRPPDTLRLACLLLMDRQPGDEAPRITAVPTTEAVARLGEQTSFLNTIDRPLHFLADIVRAAGGARQVTYGDAADLVGPLRELLATDQTPSADAPVATPPRSLVQLYGAGEAPYEESDDRVRRAPVTDFLLDGDLGVAMVGNQVLALPAVSTRVLTLVGDDMVSVGRLAGALVGEFGSPPGEDPRRLVDALVAELAEAGLLERV